ncbi:hypothetical protein B9G55_16955 [Saccharibacillus sp. O16]|nr:hypothetical protein B9G55_16955 [Saccharibacillus sp. O16]
MTLKMDRATAIEASIRFLENPSSFTSDSDEISRRKWDGAWWHMTALYEMGEAKSIPAPAVERAKHLLHTQVWRKFVIHTEDAPVLPEDLDLWDCCHCELATFYQVLSACGCDLEREMPWIREWLLSHQLPDGGLNCDPDAYLYSHKSSIVSTLPPLEVVLSHTKGRDFTEKELHFLDEGARYLIEHQLVCSKSSGQVIHADWLKPCFPRFFEYDLLRGLNFLVGWSKLRSTALPEGFVEKACARMQDYIDDDGKGSRQIKIGRQVWDPDGEWGGETFALLEALPGIGEVCEFLHLELESTQT